MQATISRVALAVGFTWAWGLAACAAEPSTPGEPLADGAADTAADTATDTATDTGAAPDTPPDTPTDAAPDTPIDAAPDTPTDAPTDATADTGPTGPIAAVLGARCAPMERVGLIELGDAWGSRSLNAQLYDIPNPLFSQPALSDAACDFFQFQGHPPCSPGCADGETCGLEGTCVPQPQAALDAVVTLTAGGEQQTFTPDQVTGQLWGDVTLAADVFAVRVQWLGQEIALEATPIPAELPDLAGQLQGDSSMPTGLDLTWTPTGDSPADPNGPQVFTDIPINHHAGGPTHTVCAVPDTAGALHVDGAMLKPLAIITGLEFQGAAHVQFAAAETPLGCVELRLRAYQFVDLGY